MGAPAERCDGRDCAHTQPSLVPPTPATDTVTAADLILTPGELEALTGYRRAGEQLAELHRRGFIRARRSHAGGVILERAHYLAVCAGCLPDVAAPRVKPPRLKAVA